MIPLSQSHLTYLDTCDRKYQYVFFDALLGPVSYDQHVKTQWGSQFHLLMQQQALNLPVEALSPANADMASSLSALETAAPEVFSYLRSDLTHNPSDIFSQSEHRRTLEFNGYLLTVIYDLLVLSVDTPEPPSYRKPFGQIFDWKTHQQPPKEAWLRNDWQTRLYLYVLCETSELTPEQISMTYWFVRVEAQTKTQQPSFYRYGYTLAQHDQTRRDLQRLTDELSQMQEQAYFPKVAVEKGFCDRCPFISRCDRDRTQSNPANLFQAAQQLTAETVEEIPL